MQIAYQTIWTAGKKENEALPGKKNETPLPVDEHL